MSAGQPFFTFKCDIDGKFAVVRLYRGRISWQSARVSSTVRLLAVGIPSAVILGVVIGLVAAWAFRQTFSGVWDVVFAVAIGILTGFVFGYRLGALLGDAIFPTRTGMEQSLTARSGMSISTRGGGRIFSFIRVQSSADTVELRVSPRYADFLAGKLRATAHS